MSIMETTLRLLNFAGICDRPEGKSSSLGLRQYATRFIIIFVLILNPFPQTVYLIGNLDNIVAVSFSIYYIVVGYGNLSQYCILVANESQFWDLFGAIEEVVVTKTVQNGFEHFAKTKQFLKTVLSVSEKATWGIYVIYVSSPMLIILQAYFTDKLTDKMFVSPMADLYYFFDASHSPLFEIFYLVNMFKLAFVVLAFVVVDVTFVEISFYILAMYDELTAMLRQLKRTQKYERADLMNCIKFHVEIVAIIKQSARIINPIVSVQLMYSLFTLATNTFTALYVRPEEYLKMVSSCGCFVSELFIYCYLGSRILDEADRVQLSLYDLPWFEYPVEDQQSIRTLMMYTSNSKPGFCGFTYIYCNIETFKMMMSKVYTALAFLQNLV